MATKSEIRNYAATNNVSMSEARQHFINEAKRRNPKVSNIEMFGAFYKAKDDDGFAFAIDNYSAIPSFAKTLAKNVTIAGEGVLDEIKNGTWTVEGVWEQLTDAILSYNLKVFGSYERPAAGTAKVQVTSEAMPELIAIMSDIYALSQLSLIQSDDNNGMMYVYSS